MADRMFFHACRAGGCSTVEATLLYLGVRKRLGRQENAFDLGRFDMPVAIGALVWSVLVVFVLVSPPEALTAVLISVMARSRIAAAGSRKKRCAVMFACRW
jgi:hypothetical protein